MSYAVKPVLLWLTFLVALAANPSTWAVEASFVKRLREDHSATIVTMGTSLTGGGSNWVTPFAAWLADEFGDKAKVVNVGVGASASQTVPAMSPQVKGRCGLDAVEKVAGIKPDAVFIEFAVNDAYVPYGISLEQSKTNLNTIINRILAAHQDAEIIVMTMNSALDVPTKRAMGATHRPQLAAYYQGYRDVASQRGLRVVDLYPHWLELMNKDRPTFVQFVPDGLHPTQEAYQQVVMPVLKDTLTGVAKSRNDTK